MELHVHEYSLDELRYMIRRDLNDKTLNWNGRHSNAKIRQGFDHGMDLEDACEALTHGWDMHRAEMSEQVDSLISSLQEEVNDYIGTHHREVRDVSGGFVDMDRYLLGEPECMVESWMDEDTLQGKAIKVLVNVAAAAHVSSDKLIARGAAVAAAMDAVMTSGMNVELWVGESIGGSEPDHMLVDLLCVKEYNDLIDPDVLAFATAHPAMLRRVFFYMNEQHEESERRMFGIGPEGGYYGRIEDIPEELAETFDLVIERYQRGQEEDAEQVYRKMMRMNGRASEYV